MIAEMMRAEFSVGSGAGDKIRHRDAHRECVIVGMEQNGARRPPRKGRHSGSDTHAREAATRQRFFS